MTSNVTFIDIKNNLTKEVETHAIIDRGNGEFTSMLKSTYDEMLNAPTAFPHQPLVEGQTFSNHRFPKPQHCRYAKCLGQNL